MMGSSIPRQHASYIYSSITHDQQTDFAFRQTILRDQIAFETHATSGQRRGKRARTLEGDVLETNGACQGMPTA
jgi:hypothetical protein